MVQQCRKGLLMVISGPAGVGKGTIVKQVLEHDSNVRLSVSATTRAPRPGEIDGVHYYFISDEQFQDMISRNEFLEYVKVFNINYYGTPKKAVEELLNQGHDVILEIDVQGAMHIREVFPEAVLIFIAPPSMTELKARLVGRGTETPEVIEKRTLTAFQEIRAMDKYDYIVLNDDVGSAVARVESIVAGEKCSAQRNSEIIHMLQEGK